MVASRGSSSVVFMAPLASVGFASEGGRRGWGAVVRRGADARRCSACRLTVNGDGPGTGRTGRAHAGAPRGFRLAGLRGPRWCAVRPLRRRPGSDLGRYLADVVDEAVAVGGPDGHRAADRLPGLLVGGP